MGPGGVVAGGRAGITKSPMNCKEFMRDSFPGQVLEKWNLRPAEEDFRQECVNHTLALEWLRCTWTTVLCMPLVVWQLFCPGQGKERTVEEDGL